MAKAIESQQTLWSLPYDSDSVFKSFLKIPFSSYLNNIISNQYFTQYQAAMAKEIGDRNLWNEKSWRLIEFFELLNQNFEIDKWDNYIKFFEDSILRSTMGFFRLWIDTERLYLLNFLKLDSNQFQEDRIYMSLYRILLFFNHLFSQYMLKDFDLTFLNNFIKKCTFCLKQLKTVSTNESGELIIYIISLLQNIKKKEKFLVDPKILHTLKKNATIKVGKQAEMIKEVENRLMNSVRFKKNIDEELRLKMICKQGLLDQFSSSIRTLYDPIERIQTEEVEQYFGTAEQKQKRKEQSITQKISNYKKKVKEPVKTEVNMYDELDKSGRNPYDMQNYQIYGEAVKTDIQKRLIYQKEKETEVISVEDYDRSKFYYDQKFIEEVQRVDRYSGKITEKDINLNTQSSRKTQQIKSNEDENTKVFNLKWHRDMSSQRNRTVPDNSSFVKNYDNNLLFKSPLEDQMLQNKKNSLDKLRENLGVKSYTVAYYEELANQIHPPNVTASFGPDLFIKKSPQVLDIKNFKLINQNKFDFMRKVVGYMTAQKKIKNMINEKNVPDVYPRYYSDVKQESYNPSLQTQKVRYAMGRTDIRPELYL